MSIIKVIKKNEPIRNKQLHKWVKTAINYNLVSSPYNNMQLSIKKELLSYDIGMLYSGAFWNGATKQS